MQPDIFLKLTGITGEATDATHVGEIEVLDWDWSAGQPSSMHTNRGGSTGKCTVDDLIFEHYVDRASPVLTLHCLTGRHIANATLTMRKAGGATLEYVRLVMSDVMVTGVRIVGANTLPTPLEEVSLSFARFQQEYVIQGRHGGSAGTVSFGYDIKANRII